MVSERPFVLGVAGGTCPGKTKLADRLSELMGDDELALIKLDSYYWVTTANRSSSGRS